MPDLTPPEIILASGSPRRRELLAQMGIAFTVVTADVQELDQATASHFSPAELACENARLKSAPVALAQPDRWVLGADTVVTLEGRIFGKPASLDDARKYLRTLSGQTHQVMTGCVLSRVESLACESFYATTDVTFKALSEDLIDRYLASVNVLDKAGAYALQEHGDWIVERVVGSETNVIGLPMERLREAFLQRGLL